MRLRDYIDEDLVFFINQPQDKSSLLKTLVAYTKKKIHTLHEEVLYQRLLEREQQVSTGIGHGVAIPHAILEGMENIRCVIAKIPEGLDFQSLDAAPVQVLFLLLSPPGRTGEHIRLLARIARLLSRDQFVARIIATETTKDLYNLIVEEDSRHV